jgi:predicted phosphoribosyltransferase
VGRFANRVEAGRRLASEFRAYRGRPGVLVLALPRGGVPVAAEVAEAIGAPFDVLLVRKLGVPGHPELAMGAIAEGGVKVLDEPLISSIGIPRSVVDEVVRREAHELARRQALYRGSRALPDLAGLTVIIVDDGLATGATMEAAVTALRQLRPARVVAAAPVGAAETCARLSHHADAVVCAEMPHDFGAVGMWYDDFSETTDEEVKRLVGPREA